MVGNLNQLRIKVSQLALNQEIRLNKYIIKNCNMLAGSGVFAEPHFKYS